MSSRVLALLPILGIFLLYTSYKFTQIWPQRKYIAVAICAGLFLTMISSMFVHRMMDPASFEAPWFKALSWTSSIIFAFWATFLVISVPLDLLQTGVAIISKMSGVSEIDQKRRDMFFGSFHVSVFALSGGLAALGFANVWRGPKVKETRVTVPNLPESFEGLKITQISDLHVGPTVRTAYVAEVVRIANETDPDLIVVTGDLADGTVTSLSEHLKPLGNLKSKFGTFNVTGNHEYYWDASGLIQRMSELGFKTLINENAVLSIGQHKLMIAGVTDPAGEKFVGHAPDLVKALQSPEETHCKILLAHRPDACVNAEKLGFDLQFSGHTHSGQFFPFSLLIGLAHKYHRGLYRHGKIQVYVNPGTGFWGPANRLGVTAEISVISLHKA